MKTTLEAEKTLRESADINENDYQLVKDVQLITSKPMFFVANVSAPGDQYQIHGNQGAKKKATA